MVRAKQATDQQLREWFVADLIQDQIDRSLLRPVITADRPAPDGIGPVGTRSQMVQYYDHAGTLITEVHRYLLPDGKLGASGMPDPKGLRHGDCWFFTPT